MTAAYPADRFAILADRLGALLSTRNDVVFVGGEAIVALEAVATSLAAPGRAVVNVVTSPYGEVFGRWLRRGGSPVTDVHGIDGHAVALDAVAAAIEREHPAAVVLAHGEAASGIVNPLPEIAALAKGAGALLVVDAVASVGGEPLLVDEWGADLTVIGPQKALDGPASLSAVAVSETAWDALTDDFAGPDSVLSLLALRRGWLDAGRGALPGTPDPAAYLALDEALSEVEAEGFAARIERHRAAAALARAGAAELGLAPWAHDDEASHLVTTATIPEGLDPVAFLAGARALDPSIAAGIGAVAGRVVRLNHTGVRADLAAVRTSLAALAAALE